MKSCYCKPAHRLIWNLAKADQVNQQTLTNKIMWKMALTVKTKKQRTWNPWQKSCTPNIYTLTPTRGLFALVFRSYVCSAVMVLMDGKTLFVDYWWGSGDLFLWLNLRWSDWAASDSLKSKLFTFHVWPPTDYAHCRVLIEKKKYI